MSPGCYKHKQNEIWAILWGHQIFLQFNENLISYQDAHSQIKSDETPEAEHPNETDSEEGETNKSSALSSFMPKKYWMMKS